MDLFPFSVALFPNIVQAVVWHFNCLSIDKEEIFVYIQYDRFFCPTWTGQAIEFLSRVIPMMKSGGHVFISRSVKVSSHAY